MASAAVFIYLEKCFSKENLKMAIDLETIEIDPDAAPRESRLSSFCSMQIAYALSICF